MDVRGCARCFVSKKKPGFRNYAYFLLPGSSAELRGDFNPRVPSSATGTHVALQQPNETSPKLGSASISPSNPADTFQLQIWSILMKLAKHIFDTLALRDQFASMLGAGVLCLSLPLAEGQHWMPEILHIQYACGLK